MHDPKTGKKRREKRLNMVRFGELKIGNRSSIIQAIRTPFSIARRAALHCRRRPNPQAERTEVPFSCHPARETKMAGGDQIWRKRRRKQRNDGCTAGADAGRNRGTPGGKLAAGERYAAEGTDGSLAAGRDDPQGAAGGNLSIRNLGMMWNEHTNSRFRRR